MTSEAEGAVRDNITRKQEQCQQMIQEMIRHTQEILSNEIQATVRMTEPYNPSVEMEIPAWCVTGGISA